MSEDKDTSLTLGDRMNYPYALMKAALSFLDVIRMTTGEQEVIEACLAFRAFIPKEIEDEEFRTDIKNATQIVTEDIREVWCGIKVGPQKNKEIKVYNYYELPRAIFGLLYRLGMLSRTEFMEELTGEAFVDADD